MPKEGLPSFCPASTAIVVALWPLLCGPEAESLFCHQTLSSWQQRHLLASLGDNITITSSRTTLTSLYLITLVPLQRPGVVTASESPGSWAHLWHIGQPKRVWDQWYTKCVGWTRRAMWERGSVTKDATPSCAFQRACSGLGGPCHWLGTFPLVQTKLSSIQGSLLPQQLLLLCSCEVWPLLQLSERKFQRGCFCRLGFFLQFCHTIGLETGGELAPALCGAWGPGIQVLGRASPQAWALGGGRSAAGLL